MIDLILISSRGSSLAAVICVILPLVAGCGRGDRPPLSPVHGRVTLDGKPLAHACVVFHPLVAGRESGGTTDENGEYRLRYIGDVMGGVIGQNIVRITKQSTPDPKSQRVPARYNRDSTLREEIVSGDNEINFDLTSGTSS